jgi:hypothetical protein
MENLMIFLVGLLAMLLAKSQMLKWVDCVNKGGGTME